MDRAMWQRHLRLAKRQIAEARTIIGRQRQIVGELEQDGHDTIVAQALLILLEVTLQACERDRDRLQADLCAAGAAKDRRQPHRHAKVSE